MEYERVEDFFQGFAKRDRNHGFERIGRTVFKPLSDDEWLEVIAAICKNNFSHEFRVPPLIRPDGWVQDDSEIFPIYELLQVRSGGKLSISGIRGGFKVEYHP